jgi:cytoskeletal protein RodZ
MWYYVITDKKQLMEEIMADNKKRIRFKSIAILEAVIILILAVGLVWVGFIKGRKDAVPANSSNKPQVRRRAVIDKEESFYQLDGKKLLMHDSTYG